MDEIELKFLNISVPEIKQKLNDIGAELKYALDTTANCFSGNGFSETDSTMKGLRVRRMNGKTKVTYKGPAKDSEMTTREELEFGVDDYDKAVLLFEKLGFTKEDTFRKHREHYELGDVHFELDTLENLPTYLEIETQSEEAMHDICKKLDIDISTGKKGTIFEIVPNLKRK